MGGDLSRGGPATGITLLQRSTGRGGRRPPCTGQAQSPDLAFCERSDSTVGSLGLALLLGRGVVGEAVAPERCEEVCGAGRLRNELELTPRSSRRRSPTGRSRGRVMRRGLPGTVVGRFQDRSTVE